MEWATAESMRPAKSTFVTVVAWIFIAMDGLGAFILVIQNIVIGLMPFERFHESMAKADAQAHMPDWFMWMFDHIRPVLFAFLIYTLIKLAAAIGLLRRRNWARLFFIAILALGIVWSFAGIALQQVFLSSMPVPPQAPKEFTDTMQGMMIAIRVISAIFAIGFGVLYAWMIKMLLSPAIVAEFTGGSGRQA